MRHLAQVRVRGKSRVRVRIRVRVNLRVSVNLRFRVKTRDASSRCDPKRCTQPVVRFPSRWSGSAVARGM